MLRPICGLLLVLLAPPSASAQASAPQPVPHGAELATGVAAWRAEHGPAWRAVAHADSGRLELLYGGSAAPSRAPVVDEDFAVLAREAIARTRGLHGIAPEQLVTARVHFLPLAQIGSTDKLSVSLTQTVGGVPVRDGTVECLFDVNGRLLALHARGVDEAERIELTPLVPAQRARSIAAAMLEADEHEVATSVGDAALEIVRAGGGRLAWRVEARNEVEDAMPAGRTYWIDARDGTVLDSQRSIHEFEVRGNVRALITPGTAPDTDSNPEVAVPMRYLDVSSSAGDVRTDANGDFVLPGVTTPLAVTVSFTGAWNNVVNAAGSEYVLTTTLPPDQDNVLTMNPSSSAQVTAQGNAFHHVNRLRDYVRAVDPSDTHADFTATSNVNVNQICNAFFDGDSTNFFLSGGPCVNTAYSTVIAHEMGHWLNERYGTGNGPDGMGEGNADVWAMYANDTPVVGLDYCGPGCSMRTGTNTRLFCGDATPQCHSGGPHNAGEVWMGAAWKVRERLNTALGDVMGDMTANTLFIGWMNAFNQSQIRSIIETQWLLLDDDDGNLNDGTPHYDQIDGGFRQQGFPGVELRPVTIEDVTLLPDTSVEVGPYGVEARVRAQFEFEHITSASLSWRVNGGTWTQRPLVPQGADIYGNSIAPVASPALVDYYLEATDSQGNSQRWPGPNSHETFRVGAHVPVWGTDFESGPAGWTHSTYRDSSGPDEWELGTPSGGSGAVIVDGEVLAWSDPNSTTSGTHCWGTDLAYFTNGRYGANVHYRLLSPVIDCTGALGVHLRFQRWLTVQAGSADQARVRVNGNIAWSNPVATSVIDTAWSLQDIEISSWADDNASVQIEFELASNASVHLGGWNLDEFELTRLGPATQECTEPTGYGPGKLNSTGNTARLIGVGQPSLLNGPFHIRLEQGVPLRAAMVYSSSAPATTPLLGGTMLIAQPYAREIGWRLDTLGNATALYPVTPALVGTTRFFQCLFRDPANPDGTGMGFSKALRVGFCP